MTVLARPAPTTPTEILSRRTRARKKETVILQGQELTPLDALQCFDPVTRHEMHGSLEGRLECLWKSVEKFRELKLTHYTATQLCEAQESMWTALGRLNEQAELTIKDFTRVYPTD